MKRVLGLAFLSLALALPATTPADDVVNWKLTTLAPLGNSENTSWLFKFETTDGKTTATVISALPAGKAEPQVVSFEKTDDRIRLVVKTTTEQTFEGRMTKDGKKIMGIFGTDKVVAAAYMVPTTVTKLEKAGTGKVTMPPDEFQAWADAASQAAKERGALASAEVNSQIVLAMLVRKTASAAVEFARAAEKALDENTPLELQEKILQNVAKALKAAYDADVKELNEKLVKLDKALDEDYVTKVPPFKGQRFAGRKGQSNRAVVMELFTGAQCPPCVAADVAFDVLQKTYDASDLVLIQYHLHIPGPDPMTNSDTEGRAKYYKANSTPSTFFNGASKAGGGGGMTAAEKKYEAYRRVIDPLLEEAAACKITASAKRVGDRVMIQSEVSGLEKPGKDIKLRLVLVEDTIRFVGSNKLRFHHQVVRAMPGGVDGASVENESMLAKQEIDLKGLRRDLVTYLDNYALNKRAFPQPGRPLDLQGLRLIAFVQDDSTREILQAVQVNVE